MTLTFSPITEESKSKSLEMHSTKSFICIQFVLICAITVTQCYPRYPPREYMDLQLDEEHQQSPQLIPLVPLIVQTQPQPEQKFYILPYKQEKKAPEEDDDSGHDNEDSDTEPSLDEFMPKDSGRKTRTRCTKKVLFDDAHDNRPQRSNRPPPRRSPSWSGLSDSPPRGPPKHFDVHVGKPNSKSKFRKFRKGYKIDFVENTEGDVGDSDSDHHHY